MNSIVRSHAKYVQVVTVRDKMRRWQGSWGSTDQDIRLTYNAAEGMRVRYPGTLTPESRELVEGLVKDAKDAETALDIPHDNRLLLLALALRPELWDEDELRLE